MGLFDKLRRRKKEAALAAGAVNTAPYSETIVGFVLLENEDCNFEQFITTMKNEWDIEIEERPEEGNLFSKWMECRWCVHILMLLYLTAK